MATFITIASFAWTLVVGILKSIDWSSKWTIAVLMFVGGCQFDRSFLWHPKAAAHDVTPSPVQPRKPILPLRASEAGAGERQHVPVPDPISTPGVKQPADETRPKMADLLDDVNADLNAQMNFDPNPKPVGTRAASQCGPEGCPPAAGGGKILRRIFRRRG